MPLFTAAERRRAEGIERIVYGNPFLPERVEAERAVLGERFHPSGEALWSGPKGRVTAPRPNVVAVAEVADALAEALRAKLLAGTRAADARDQCLYESVVMHAVFYRRVRALHARADVLRAGGRLDSFAREHAALAEDLRHFLGPPLRLGALGPADAAHLLACFYQIARAFGELFDTIVGTSPAAARLRAAAWQSVFTHDARRYRRVLFDKAADLTTLVVGPSGTGKELVARALAQARYLPYDARRGRFEGEDAELFFPLNVSALAPTLVEGELFGHRRGAFTGAVDDRQGWLAACPALGTVFLDEVGELDGLVQVKLLRVLQTRVFHALGEQRARVFAGKLVAATNRDLGAELAAGRFRADFYYRLCGDVIETPGLAEQLADSPGELRHLACHVARRLLPGDDADAERLADETVACVRATLGDGYAWPGNFRELEQCVRNVLVRGAYRPARAGDDLASAVAAGTLTVAELTARYVRAVHARAGSYEATARAVGLDRRTVKAHVASAR